MASIFTKIIDGQIPGNFVWADDQCVAFADINPHTDGHVLVVPRQEVSSYLEASDELLAHLTVVAKRIGQAQVKAFDAPRSGLAIVGFDVDHLHLHVLPIYQGGALDSTKVRQGEPLEKIAAAMDKLRAALRDNGWAQFVPAND